MLEENKFHVNYVPKGQAAVQRGSVGGF